MGNETLKKAVDNATNNKTIDTSERESIANATNLNNILSQQTRINAEQQIIKTLTTDKYMKSLENLINKFKYDNSTRQYTTTTITNLANQTTTFEQKEIEKLVKLNMLLKSNIAQTKKAAQEKAKNIHKNNKKFQLVIAQNHGQRKGKNTRIQLIKLIPNFNIKNRNDLQPTAQKILLENLTNLEKQINNSNYNNQQKNWLTALKKIITNKEPNKIKFDIQLFSHNFSDPADRKELAKVTTIPVVWENLTPKSQTKLQENKNSLKKQLQTYSNNKKKQQKSPPYTEEEFKKLTSIYNAITNNTNTQQKNTTNRQKSTKSVNEILKKNPTQTEAKEFFEWTNEAEYNKVWIKLNNKKAETNKIITYIKTAYNINNITPQNIQFITNSNIYPQWTKVIKFEQNEITFWDTEKELQRRVDKINQTTIDQQTLKIFLAQHPKITDKDKYFTALTKKVAETWDSALIAQMADIKYLWESPETKRNNIDTLIAKLNPTKDKKLIATFVKLRLTNDPTNKNSLKWQLTSIMDYLMTILDDLWLEWWLESSDLFKETLNKLKLWPKKTKLAQKIWAKYKPKNLKELTWSSMKYDKNAILTTRKNEAQKNKQRINRIDPNLKQIIWKKMWLKTKQTIAWDKIDINQIKNYDNFFNQLSKYKDFRKNMWKAVWKINQSSDENPKIKDEKDLWIFLTAWLMSYKIGWRAQKYIWTKTPWLWIPEETNTTTGKEKEKENTK